MTQVTISCIHGKRQDASNLYTKLGMRLGVELLGRFSLKSLYWAWMPEIPKSINLLAHPSPHPPTIERVPPQTPEGLGKVSCPLLGGERGPGCRNVLNSTLEQSCNSPLACRGTCHCQSRRQLESLVRGVKDVCSGTILTAGLGLSALRPAKSFVCLPYSNALLVWSPQPSFLSLWGEASSKKDLARSEGGGRERRKRDEKHHVILILAQYPPGPSMLYKG